MNQQTQRQTTDPREQEVAEYLLSDDERLERLLAMVDPPKVAYTSSGDQSDIKISARHVRRYLCVPSKRGVLPSDSDVMHYMAACKAMKLNPWLKEVYLLGYDNYKDRQYTGTTFNIIISVAAFLKRACYSPAFDGIEHGVIVQRGDEIIERKGEIRLKGETLLGGWARVYRKDRSHPHERRINLGAYAGKSRWSLDPEGMIAKCAIVAVIREAFPSDVSGVYAPEEIDAIISTKTEPVSTTKTVSAVLDAAPEREPVEPEPGPAPDPEPPPKVVPKTEPPTARPQPADPKPGAKARAMFPADDERPPWEEAKPETSEATHPEEADEPEPEDAPTVAGHDWIGDPAAKKRRKGSLLITPDTHAAVLKAIAGQGMTPEEYCGNVGIESVADDTEEGARSFIRDCE